MAFVKLGRSRMLIVCILGIGLALLPLWSSACVLDGIDSYIFNGVKRYVRGQEREGRPVNLDIILLIDNSWSMSHGDPAIGAPPSDPEELRIRAAKFLVDYLRANAETLGVNYRVGVVSFGGEIGDVVPLRLLQDETVRNSIEAEEIQFTDFRRPLQFALREFETRSLGTGNKMAVILLTDGRPHLPDGPMTEQELQVYFQDLAPLVDELQEGEVSLFVLGIGDAREDRENWIQLIPEDHYVGIRGTAELAGVYHRIVGELIGVAVSREETLLSGSPVFIEVEPYLERVVFSFMRTDPTSRITLTYPAGDVVMPTIGGTPDVHHVIYGITNPDPGKWEVLWEGEGEVRYWVDRQYPLIRVDPAESSSPVRQPITITASLVRNNEPVEDPDLQLEAEIGTPDGDVVTQALSPIGEGRYTGSFENVEVEGVYTVTAKAFLDGQPLTARPLSVTVDVFPLPVVATSTPSPSPSPSATPTATPPVPTATPQPIVGSVLSAIERYWWLFVLIGVGIVLAFGLLRRQAVAWIDKIADAPDPETALQEFQTGVESEKARVQPLEEEVTRSIRKGAIALYERHVSKEEPMEVVLSGVAQVSADENEAVRRGTAEALTDILFREDERDILRHLLTFAKHASRVVRGTAPREQEQVARRISNTLHQARLYGRSKAGDARRAGRDSAFAPYNLISALSELYSDFWLWRGTYPTDVRDLLRQSEDLLDNPLLQNAAFRDELHTLYHLLYEVLGEVRFAEDTVPLPLPSIPPDKTSEAEGVLQAMLGQYEARDGVAAVLKHLANQRLYPLAPFLRQLEKAEQELEDQEGNLLVPDEVTLRFLFQKWRNAAEADLEHRRAALSSVELVNEQAYVPKGKRELTIRVALHNVSDRARVGRAEHVSVTVEPPLSAYTLDPPLGSIPLILPWETDVTYDLTIAFPDDLQPGQQSIPLKVVFSDLAEGDCSFSDTVEIELLEQREELDEMEYDALALVEIERMTGGRDELGQLIKGAIADAYPEPRVLFLEDVQRVINKLSDSLQVGRQLGWGDLSEEEKVALLELERLLAIEGRAHVKMLEIRRRLSNSYPDRLVNWNRVLRGLVRKGHLREKNGLYRFGVGLLRTWIAKHETEIARG